MGKGYNVHAVCISGASSTKEHNAVIFIWNIPSWNKIILCVDSTANPTDLYSGDAHIKPRSDNKYCGTTLRDFLHFLQMPDTTSY
jgi:hypothetical protein